MEEFNIQNVSVDKFKCMAGAEPFASQVKFANTSRFIELNVPQIYLSNHKVGRNDVHEAVYSRINIVDSSMGQAYTSGFASNTTFGNNLTPEYSDLWSWNTEKVFYCYTALNFTTFLYIINFQCRTDLTQKVLLEIFMPV